MMYKLSEDLHNREGVTLKVKYRIHNESDLNAFKVSYIRSAANVIGALSCNPFPLFSLLI